MVSYSACGAVVGGALTSHARSKDRIRTYGSPSYPSLRGSSEDGEPCRNRIAFGGDSRVTQMVHDLGEQVVPQRFEDLRQKMVQVARAAPSCHQTQQAVRSQGHHPNSRLTSTGPPHLSS
ncbi:hypothetical protein KIN20_031952 [Parelaphostrongylus tenuis]|uniref:Uncharacterized protein n=1 Tax=Parelaphostrongylus tenuis TaxID=148309 RepID=A0AAD5R694_PARTN|nr:hypothetical protein KIN20_031952 [Parelaphostrongylus tenuis]